jgi:hypothetical protein
MAQQSGKPPDGVSGVESAANQDSLLSEVMGMASVFRSSRQRNRLLMMAAALIAVVERQPMRRSSSTPGTDLFTRR